MTEKKDARRTQAEDRRYTDLSNLAPLLDKPRDRKRVGRGQGSTLGKTSGKGQKGQKSRTGGSVPIGFEGGQTPLHRRLPKFGFTPRKRVEYAIVNLQALEKCFEEGAVVDLESLKSARLIRRNATRIKVLAEGEVSKKLTLKVNKISTSAKEKIEAAGGTVEVI